MNELTRPWPHWDASPEVVSTDFNVPTTTARSRNFIALTSGRFKRRSASALEPIIRAGHARVSSARLQALGQRPADVTTLLGLLRPLFCDEQVNYVTERGDGTVLVDLIVSADTRDLLGRLRFDRFGFLSDDQLTLPSPHPSVLVQAVPVRGSAMVDYASSLAAEQVLSPLDLLRVRALDWKRPVLSTFRCNLLRSATRRLLAHPPRFAATVSNRDALRQVFAAVMTLDGAPLAAAPGGKLVVIDEAEALSPEARQRLALAGTAHDVSKLGCDGGLCLATAERFGETLSRFIEEWKHAGPGGWLWLAQEIRRRTCYVKEHFKSAPPLPEVKCI
jgi:hypothetical protein